MRPSITASETSTGQFLMVDTSQAKSKGFCVAAIVSTGNISSRILAESQVAAFTVEQAGKENISANEISKTLQENGFDTDKGVLMLKTASKRDLRLSGKRVMEVEVIGELELDHVLSLLSASTETT